LHKQFFLWQTIVSSAVLPVLLQAWLTANATEVLKTYSTLLKPNHYAKISVYRSMHNSQPWLTGAAGRLLPRF
jgi:hypothetical protein